MRTDPTYRLRALLRILAVLAFLPVSGLAPWGTAGAESGGNRNSGQALLDPRQSRTPADKCERDQLLLARETLHRRQSEFGKPAEGTERELSAQQAREARTFLAPYCRDHEPLREKAQWRHLERVLADSTESEEVIAALQEIRSGFACHDQKRLGEGTDPSEFLQHHLGRFGKNPCLEYWQNQVLCVLSARGHTVEFGKLSLKDKLPRTCPRLLPHRPEPADAPRPSAHDDGTPQQRSRRS